MFGELYKKKKQKQTFGQLKWKPQFQLQLFSLILWKMSWGRVYLKVVSVSSIS